MPISVCDLSFEIRHLSFQIGDLLATLLGRFIEHTLDPLREDSLGDRVHGVRRERRAAGNSELLDDVFEFLPVSVPCGDHYVPIRG